MSSRVATPISKMMARSISTTASVARPTHLLNSTAKATAAAKSKSTSKTNGARKRQSKTAVVQETAGESADVSRQPNDCRF